jgi:DNA-binding CsgD family transcriptional regulator
MNIENLSKRDLLVWKYVVEGLTIREIADKLGIRFDAANMRIGLLYLRLGLPHEDGVSRRTQLVRAAQQFTGA